MLDFYKNEWHGSFSGTDEALSLLLSRAADIVDCAIFPSGFTVEEIPVLFRRSVYSAVCAQADRIDSMGGAESLTESGYSSVTLGKFSYSEGSSTQSSDAFSLCALAKGYLESVGLLYRGVAVM
ncbi:MAG: hypothetical protein E7511_05820 [Ruminococcus sp.]|nr:hypothetical protein [Ruminococcus sp.]MBQ7003365.1 hypothetical protein [Oscillospiraceae bacterium]